MNRIEFMNRLSLLLSDLPDSERSEALAYYNDYLDDAGVENEQEVLHALGTPEQVAESIRAGLAEDAEHMGEFSERGYRTGQDEDIKNEVETQYHTANEKEKEKEKPRKKGVGLWIVMITCVICALPVLLPLAIAFLAVCLSLIVASAAVGVSLLVAGAVCIAAGIAALVVAIAKVFVVPSGAMLVAGASLLCIGAGIFLVLGMGVLLGKVVPAMFRGCVKLCRRLLVRKGGQV